MDAIKEDFSSEKVSKVFIKTFDQKYFKIEYYKLRTLLLLAMNKAHSEMDVGKPKYSKERIEGSLNISFSKENLTSINGENFQKRH